MRIEEETKLDFDDVLIRPKRSTMVSRKDVVLEREFEFFHSKKKWKGIPIMTANMATSGTFEMARVLSPYKIITTFHKFYSLEDYRTFFKTFDNPDYIVYTLGIRDEDIEKLRAMIQSKLINKFSFICIDVPNGYLQRFIETIRIVRALCKDHIIIAGNIVTNEMAEEIILAGADMVKIGIGSGSACLTRRMTGIGYPQVSAVIECSDAAHGLSNGNGGCGLAIADGGQKNPADLVKAFCAGADFNLCGSLFSGFEESGGKTITKKGKKYKEYFGSSSNKALEEFYGKKEAHRASEGRYVLMPHKGSIHTFIQDLLGGIRSAGTYIGARKMKEFPKRATFIRVSRQLNNSLESFDQENKR